jgi:site-specific DNA-methyltransferase (adenine-specific)|tara:strand:+ start:434 stop:1336 length:903 start_codon:yes stop_codon:yes gene_type:complete
MYNVYNQNCIEGMRDNVNSNSVDLIFTDPPYGIEGDKLDAHYHRDETNVVPGYVEVPLETYDTFSKDWITECARCLRPGGSMYIVSGYTNLHHILNALHSTDLVEINHIIAKYSFGVSTKKKFVSSHYHVLFWQKPDKGKQKRTFNTNVYYTDQKDSYHDRLSVQDMPRAHNPGETKNKNQLNETFIEKFILYSSNRNDIVMDPFCGGFTTPRTALRYGRNFVGFEMNKNAYDAFLPTLDTVDKKDDPTPIEPDPEELVKRNKMREGWSKKRAQRKAEANGESEIFGPNSLFKIGPDSDS